MVGLQTSVNRINQEEVMNELGKARMRRAVFIERDGVLNRLPVREGKPSPPRRIEEFAILPGAQEGCVLLKQHGFLLVVTAGMPQDVCGARWPSVTAAMHDVLVKHVPIDHIELNHAGLHADNGLGQLAVDWGVDCQASFRVMAHGSDIHCTRMAGCSMVFVGNGSTSPPGSQTVNRTYTLLDAARWIVAQNRMFPEEIPPFGSALEFAVADSIFQAPRW